MADPFKSVSAKSFYQYLMFEFKFKQSLDAEEGVFWSLLASGVTLAQG